MNIINERIEIIRNAFPEAIVDGRVDFDTLRILLGDNLELSNEKDRSNASVFLCLIIFLMMDFIT